MGGEQNGTQAQQQDTQQQEQQQQTAQQPLASGRICAIARYNGLGFTP